MAGVWHIREGISEALSKAGAVYKYDISLPLPQLYDLVQDARARLQGEDGALRRPPPPVTRRAQCTARQPPTALTWSNSHAKSPTLCPRTCARAAGAAEVVAFGHIGDGNLHLNVSTPTKSQAVFDKLEPWIFEWTREKRGSVSAEHGVGTMKPQYVHMSKTAETIALMKQLKAVMDPNGILNPYKVLPA